MTAYYNEIDPFAAEWLRNLIKAGHIADGVVDTRSIEDVTPADLKDFVQCHFFAGIGVWSYALRLSGVPDDRPVWSGSCPCQPFSAAGKGGGFTDERHLWPAWFHLIEQCRPGLIYGEQVADRGGLTWLDLVHTDMEGTGYAFGAVDTCSAGFGAPHRRQRLRFVAMDNAEHTRLERLAGDVHNGHRSRRLGTLEAGYAAATGASGRLADTTVTGRVGRRSSETGGRSGSTRVEPQRLCDADRLADDNGVRLEQIADTEHHAQSRGGAGLMGDASSRGCGVGGDASQSRDSGHAYCTDLFGGLADTDGGNASAERQQCSGEQRQQPQDGGNYSITLGGLADTKHDERRSDVTGRGTQGRTVDGGIGEIDRPRPTNGFWRAVDWLLCRDPSGPKWRPVEPGTFPLFDGSTPMLGRVRADQGHRTGRLKGYGNAVDAQATKAFIDATLDL